jgi:Fic family protein
MFSEIDAMKTELAKRRPLSRGELERLRDEFLVEYTFNSNAIEGNTLTLQETALVLEGVTIGKKPLREHLEAVGHRDAFLYIYRIVADNEPMSETIIKNVHSLVLMDRPQDKGVYRRIPVRIMGASHEPPEPYLVPDRMERLVAELHDVKSHPIESAASFHLKFEGIHPFVDGNGRTGRLLMNFMLMQNGYPPIDVKFTDRKRYYGCFDDYFNGQSSAEMAAMIAEYLRERLAAYLSMLGQE